MSTWGVKEKYQPTQVPQCLVRCRRVRVRVEGGIRRSRFEGKMQVEVFGGRVQEPGAQRWQDPNGVEILHEISACLFGLEKTCIMTLFLRT